MPKNKKLEEKWTIRGERKQTILNEGIKQSEIRNYRTNNNIFTYYVCKNVGVGGGGRVVGLREGRGGGVGKKRRE